MPFRVLVVSVLIILLLAGMGVAFYVRSTPEEPPNPSSFEPYSTTLEGIYTCLPHTNTSGPQTLECALGLQADDGKYYALDFSKIAPIPPVVPTGSRIRGNGIVTPVERLSSDHWRKYPITGIFSVTDSFGQVD